MPNRLLNPKLWLGGVTTMAVALLVVDDMRPRGPGPLATVHDRHPDLDSRGDCEACHGDGETSMSEACIVCHELVGAHVEGGLGLHGSFAADVSTQCALCHTDHHGEDFQLVNVRSFAIAGIEDPADFSHDLVGFEMEGGHLDLDCTECHEHAGASVLDEGAFRFLGLNQDCRSCHQDPHEGQMGRACASCHGQDSFDALSEFEHDDLFPLLGTHATTKCLDCHEVDSANSIETLTSRDTDPSVRQCVRCHESPHSTEFSTGTASLLTQLPGSSCVECHAPTEESFKHTSRDLTPEEHAQSGFELDAPHVEVTCDQCHTPDVEEFAQAYPGRLREDCAACHEDPHEGQFSEGPFAAGCLECHDKLAFAPHAFTERQHARTSMPLTGKHLEQECVTCHELKEGSEVRPFAGTSDNCGDCHEDSHGGFFEEHALPELVADAHDCASCHGTGSFGGAEAQSFDHASWTGFELLGAHSQNDCASCHGRSEEPDAKGRHLGRIQERRGELRKCAACHEDPHQERFDTKEFPSEIDGQTGCARCHVETSFRLFTETFKHSLWTGFELEGTHGSTACFACHEPLKKQAPDGRTWKRAKGRACSACHNDPHGGQFEQEGSNDCSRCHSPVKEFAQLHFDHEKDTEFALSEAHAKLACSACHRREDIGGVRTERYSPLGHECVDCHGVSRSRLRPRDRREKP